ncbi:uncharacterized protein KY384_002319 [Bacidia gigantensis]|uniref:uncharacterized protein n=1 Tax=Bacidia gigantensis TaxID=2732470 RepID=UPI001D0447D2|nr:uncharacterized protein KY384_002319 [Bacidia gigantensis]KAG8532442.1 hypothetical protein KY384_002319 [Bacidia gigantensis]
MTDSRSAQCAALSKVLPNAVIFPSDASYATFSGSYWSKQEESVSPSCVVRPNSAQDVSTIIKTLTQCNDANSDPCSFAIRGGGHTPWAGSANIEGGVTIDMKEMNEIDVNKDQAIVSVGAGAIWGEVYKKTDSLGLSVVGGRGASIGVGGLLTGGGISYFSARKGFACDNVVNYEIVLGDGRIVDASAESNPDLWLALKGGSNNFGVVTRFDMRASEQGDFWGGSIIYADSVTPQLLQSFATLNDAHSFDEYAALIFSFSYTSAYGFLTAANIEYTKATPNPPAFHDFTAAKPQLMNTMRISNQTDFTTEFVQSQPSGRRCVASSLVHKNGNLTFVRRQLYLTSTFGNDLSFLNFVYDLFKSMPFAPLGTIPNLAISVTIQPMPPAITSRSGPLGGNSLGLNLADGSLVLCLLSATWDSAADDYRIRNVVNTLHDGLVAEARKRSLLNDWIYLNYADKSQDPIAGYGSEVKKRLRETSAKYDSDQIFQKMVPGGFKLS